MNYLISAYSVNPYHGSEDGVGWNWVLQYEKNYKQGDRIILLTKKFNEADTRKGFKEFNIEHVELVIVDVPDALNWFREKYSIFHHMYYILWQHWAWRWVKKSGIDFDVIHHVTMGDYRITGEMYKCKNAKVVFGPVGGAQITPKSLKIYEKNKVAAKIREFVNKSCDINPFYKKSIKAFASVVASNGETYRQVVAIRGADRTKQIVELGLTDEYVNRVIEEKTNNKVKILYAGRLIEKKGIIFLLDVIKQLKCKIEFELDICGDGYLSDEVHRIVAEYNLCDCVNMHGEIAHSQVTAYYQNADVFVLPSLRETGGTVLLEAMAYAVPIVAFDISFCSQLKEVGCGIFVNTDQPFDKIKNDYCNAIVTLRQNRDLARQMGMNGYKYVNKYLTWQAKYEAVLKDIM